MYLHLGQDITVLKKNIIGIFDMDTSTHSKHTRTFLTNSEKLFRVINVNNELPKSFIVYKEKNKNTKIYISPISTATLLKRYNNKNFYL